MEGGEGVVRWPEGIGGGCKLPEGDGVVVHYCCSGLSGRIGGSSGAVGGTGTGPESGLNAQQRSGGGAGGCACLARKHPGLHCESKSSSTRLPISNASRGQHFPIILKSRA